MKRFKKFIGVASAATLLAGVGVTTLPASIAEAHTGDLTVTAVCNTATGEYDLTAKLATSNVTAGNTGSTKWDVGNANFTGTPTSNTGLSRGPVSVPRNATVTLGTFSLPGTTTGKGPWVYAFTKWSPDNATKGSDGQLLTALKGDCKKPQDNDWKYTVTCDLISGTNPNGAIDSVDANVRIKNLVTGEVKTFNYHPNASGPASFSWTFTGKFGLPSSWTYYEVQWVQVNGTNYHWEVGLTCGDKPPTHITVTFPDPNPGTCDAAGSLPNLPANTDQVTWTKSGNTFTATAKSGFILDGTTSKTYTLDPKKDPDSADCVKKVDLPTIVVTPSECVKGAPSLVTADLTFGEHVKIAGATVDGTDVPNFTDLYSGHYDGPLAGHWTITFATKTGYTFGSEGRIYVLKFDVPSQISTSDCLVVPAPPIVKDKCELESDHYGLPESDGVTYSRDGKDIIATLNDSNKAWGTVAAGGWAFQDNGTLRWAFQPKQFTDEPCDGPPSKDPTYTQWVDGQFVCGDESVTQSGFRTDYTYTYAGNGNWDEHETVTPVTQTRDLTEEEIASCIVSIPTQFDATVAPPTCDLDGSLPPIESEVSTEDVHVGHVTLAWDRSYDGPGVYTLTATTDEGYTFSDGSTVKTKDLTVLAKTGYQNTDSEADCYVPPMTKEDSTITVDGTYACGDTMVTTTSVTTSYTFVFYPETGLYSDPIAHVGEPVTGTRDLTEEERTTCQEPTLDGTIVTPVCSDDAAYLVLNIVQNDPDGQSTNPDGPATVTLTDGTNEVTINDVPLGESAVLWPGAAVDPVTGKGIAWPGYITNADGTYTQTDDPDYYGWTRGPNVKALIEVNPSVTLDVDYPPASPDCLTGPPEPKPTPTPTPTTPTATPTPSDTPTPVDNPKPPLRLSQTGSTVEPLLIGGLVLLLVGGAFLALARRRGNQQ